MKNRLWFVFLPLFLLTACANMDVAPELSEVSSEQPTCTVAQPAPENSQKYDASFRLFLDVNKNSIFDAEDTLLSSIKVCSNEKFCTTDEDGVCFLYLLEGPNLVLIDASDSAISDLGFVTFRNEVYPIDQTLEVTLFTEESLDVGLSR